MPPLTEDPGLVQVRSVAVVELHPGGGARVYCDGGPDEVPILVIADGPVEFLLSPAGTPRADDVEFADRFAVALGEYLLRLQGMAS